MSFLDGFKAEKKPRKTQDQKYQNSNPGDGKGSFGTFGATFDGSRSRKEPLEEIPETSVFSLAEIPTPEEIAYAQKMLVDCFITGGKIHCWYCAACPDSETCRAWHPRRADVELFRKSDKPASLLLMEEHEAAGGVYLCYTYIEPISYLTHVAAT